MHCLPRRTTIILTWSNKLTTIEILSRLFEFGGLGTFIWFLIRGLQQRIIDLNESMEIQRKTLEAQKSTLEAMERRVQEAEKVGELYRKLLEELPQDLDKYKDTLRRIKDDVIRELEDANLRKDEKLVALTRSRLDEISKQEQLLQELPSLRQELLDNYTDLKAKLSVLDILQPGTPLGEFLKQAEHRVEQWQDHLPRVKTINLPDPNGS